MKHELPIAIGLLAIGCLPWFWQSRESSEATAAVKPPIPALTTLLQQDASVASTRPSSPMQNVIATDSTASKDLLKQVARSFRDGEPKVGDLQVESHLLGNVQTMQGRFWSGGLGTRKSRLELLTVSKTAMVTQVCDGRFQYRLTELNQEKKLSFYNIDKLDNQDAGLIESTLPATWIGQGSISNLLSNLADACRFGEMKASADNQFVEVTGTWNPDHLAKLMMNWVDHREILPETDWSKLPPHFPHGTRISFANAAGQWHPNEIVFFRFNAENGNQPTPILLVSFGTIQNQEIPEELFQIDNQESSATDETELYNERIDGLKGKQRVADEASNTIR